MRCASHVERANTLLFRSVLSHSFLLLSYFDERLTAREQVHWEVVISRTVNLVPGVGLEPTLALRQKGFNRVHFSYASIRTSPVPFKIGILTSGIQTGVGLRQSTISLYVHSVPYSTSSSSSLLSSTSSYSLSYPQHGQPMISSVPGPTLAQQLGQRRPSGSSPEPTLPYPASRRFGKNETVRSRVRRGIRYLGFDGIVRGLHRRQAENRRILYSSLVILVCPGVTPMCLGMVDKIEDFDQSLKDRMPLRRLLHRHR